MRLRSLPGLALLALAASTSAACTAEAPPESASMTAVASSPSPVVPSVASTAPPSERPVPGAGEDDACQNVVPTEDGSGYVCADVPEYAAAEDEALAAEEQAVMASDPSLNGRPFFGYGEVEETLKTKTTFAGLPVEVTLYKYPATTELEESCAEIPNGGQVSIPVEVVYHNVSGRSIPSIETNIVANYSADEGGTFPAMSTIDGTECATFTVELPVIKPGGYARMMAMFNYVDAPITRIAVASEDNVLRVDWGPTSS